MRPVIHSTPVQPPPAPQAHSKRWAWLAVAVVIALMPVLYFSHGSATAKVTAHSIRSGFSGACLDIWHGATSNGTPIDAVDCNGSVAQSWVTTATAIRHTTTDSCVAVNAAGNVVLDSCSSVPGQVWLRYQQGYFNPNTGKCLSEDSIGAQLRLASCSGLGSASEQWLPGMAAQLPACSGNEGEMVACSAVKQWTAWQASGSDHNALLTAYTDGTPYEEWCADFVSYAYKQAGYPFTNGSADGWDENDANAVQNMGLTMHMVGDGYQPKPGDVAFFDYPGGHVEIVVSGGKTPTFVYGDSAEKDPTTGNGQMKANTIIGNDGSYSGQLVYYLSPDS